MINKIIYLITALLLYANSSLYAQLSSVYQRDNMTNGELIGDPKGNISPCPSTNYTWNNGPINGFTNWKVTHGTPTAGGGTVSMFGVTTYGHVEGEGAAGDYSFYPGDKYYVDVRLNMFAQETPFDIFNISAANNLPDLNASSPATLPPYQFSCASPIPTGQDAVTLDILNFSATSYVIQAPEFSPTKLYTQLWMFPIGNTYTVTQSNVEYVRIYKCQTGRVSYTSTNADWFTEPTSCYRNNVSQIPAGLTNRETVFIWSGSTSLLKNNSQDKTKIIGRAIYLGTGSTTPANTSANIPVANVEITATNGNWFIAEAVWGCREIDNQYPPDRTGGGGGASRIVIDNKESYHGEPTGDVIARYTVNKVNEGISISMPSNDSSSLGNTTAVYNIKIHPNPTTGSFTIQLPIAEDCEIRITNIMGATVYLSSMKGEQKKQIQLDGGLPAGNYTLQLRGKTINHIEKLVLTK